MADVLRIKRRLAAGGAGTPLSLANAELAYNEATHTLYYGEGTGGSGGTASSVVPIGGSGAFLPLNGGTLNTTLGGWSSANYGKQLLLTGSTNPALGITDSAGANLIGIANAAGVLRLAGMPAYADATTAPVNLLSLSTAGNTSHTALTLANGANFGSAVAPGGNADLSRHISLYGGNQYGFGITGNRLNYNSQSAHVFLSGAIDKVTISGTGLVMAAATDITLARDPTAVLHATTKQYTDAHAGVVSVSDTPPSGILPGALWWDSVGTGLYVSYNDGNSTQWVLTNSPSTSPVTVSSFNTRTGAVTLLLADITGAGGAPIAGPTFTGTVTLAADPTLALQAVTKQYADRVTATIATVAALRASTTVTLPTAEVQVRSYAGTGVKGGGRFLYVSADTTTTDNGGTVIVDASARRWYRDGWQNGPVNVLWWGAVGDGATDDTTPIRNAVATGLAVYLPAGDYRITGQINCSTRAQRIYGDGRQQTFISITAANAAFVAGIFNVTNVIVPGGDASQVFEDFTVACTQPDTAVRASLISYPPVFYLDQATRVEFRNVRMTGGRDGIYMNGNCGGFRAVSCDFACFNRNILIDGNLDLTSFTDCEVWPYGKIGIQTTNQMSLFADANCYGVYSLRSDYLSWTGGLFLCGRSVVCGTGVRSDWPGTTYGHFTGCGFDTFGGPEVSAGNLLISDCVFSVGGTLGSAVVPTNKSALNHTGGVVTVRGSKFFVGPNPVFGQTYIYSAVPSGAATLTVEACNFETGLVDMRCLLTVGTNDYYTVIFANNKIDRLSGGNYTVAAVELAGGNGTVTGNVIGPFGGDVSGGDIFLSIASGGGPYMVRNNLTNAWATVVTGSQIASANLLVLPAVIGDALPYVIITGTTTIGGMTYSKNIGSNVRYAGIIVTLVFQAALTINSGTATVSGQFLLNNGTAFVARAYSSLTVQLTLNGNWQEIGRCI